MNNIDLTSKQASQIFWGIALVYGTVWTLFPFLMEPNFRFDVIEMFFIGREGVVSTFKHPALNSAVLEIVYQMSGHHGITPYLLNQCCYLATAWIVWRMGREFLSPREALFGAVAFYGYWAFFYKSLYYNHNVTLLPAWGLTSLFGLFALKYGRLRDWIGLGIAIGIGTHCKYTSLLLVVSILLFMTFNATTRKHWFRPGPYLTTLVSLVIAFPQIDWVVRSDFSCLKFPTAAYGLEKTLFNRCYALFNDTAYAPIILGISFVVLLFPLIGFHPRFRKPDQDQRLERNYLLAIAVLPWLLSGISSFMGATVLKFPQFSPFMIFFGPFLLLVFETRKTPQAFRRVWIFFGLTMVAYVLAYSGHIYASYHLRKTPPFYLFPGRELAEKAEKIWHDRYEKPLPYVTGGWWFGGNVAIYGKDRPSYHGGNHPLHLLELTWSGFNHCPSGNWSTDQDVLHHGGLVLWATDHDVQTLPPLVRERFPSAVLLPEAIRLDPVAKNTTEPYRVGVAIVPPDDTIPTPPFQPAPWHYYYPFKNPAKPKGGTEAGK